MTEGLALMPPKREEKPKTRKGRPKMGGRITSRYAVVTTPEYRAWMVEFMEATGELEVSDVLREGVRLLAEKKGFREPPRR